MTRIESRINVRRSLLLAAAGGSLLFAGCDNAAQGTASGAALGALVGMGLGSLSGDMGKGARRVR